MKIHSKYLDIDQILEIKSKTVALALVTRNDPVPLCVMGSGFLIDPKGYVVTAGHVITELRKIQLLAAEKKLDTTIAAIRYTFEGNKMNANYITFSDTYNTRIIYDKDPDNVIDFDIAFCRPHMNNYDLPSFDFQPTKKLNPLENIFVCGYPRASQSYALEPGTLNTQLSPLLIPGMITALTPSDTAKSSIGMFTSVTTTGGSSGSPVISEQTGNVVGIVNEVITGTTMDEQDHDVVIGRTNVGHTFGFTSHILTAFIPDYIQQLKDGKRDLETVHVDIDLLGDVKITSHS